MLIAKCGTLQSVIRIDNVKKSMQAAKESVETNREVVTRLTEA